MILAACSRLRDRFLFALLAETGIRVGQALGLRHSDFVSRRRELVIVRRVDNASGARAKTHTATTVPVSTPLVRLYSEYMHTEYGDPDSDYVFVNLFSEPVGRALRYDAVAKLVTRLRARTGIDFTPHVLRHSSRGRGGRLAVLPSRSTSPTRPRLNGAGHTLSPGPMVGSTTSPVVPRRTSPALLRCRSVISITVTRYG